ncbi:Chromodomain-helicase-DNA-binding protein 2 [Porphyridium purpureum]|uniref:Chromodomain-helicase-DNA-binding protein 2 n=1 Tax=Porphyridium purpureum TaxID=35688 RepID=A0A5J4YX43_PORPP|nr:Chromodomain-helicase-DNA-binding protein 2 [Porphyridium purpureum]|eukprot:POR0971..scf209_3
MSDDMVEEKIVSSRAARARAARTKVRPGIDIPEEFLRRSGRSARLPSPSSEEEDEEEQDEDEFIVSDGDISDDQDGSDMDVSESGSDGDWKAGGRSRKRKRRASGTKPSALPGRNKKAKQSSRLRSSLSEVDDEDESLAWRGGKSNRRVASDESDDMEWGAKGKSKGRGRSGARTSSRSRRTRANEDDDDDDDAEVRVSYRNLGRSAVTYADESNDLDDDDLLEENSDAAASFDDDDDELSDSERERRRKRKAGKKRHAKTETSEETLPKIDMVADYRTCAERDLHEELSKASAEGGESVKFKSEAETEELRRREQEALSVMNFDPARDEFLIKWTGMSHRYDSWHKLDELRALKGFTKVTNFVKRVEETQFYLESDEAMPDEHEEILGLRESNRELLREYCVVDRILSERHGSGTAQSAASTGTKEVEYLVKWCELPYAECTWEPASMLASEADMAQIDKFLERQQGRASSFGKQRLNPFQSVEKRKPYRKMATQPSWLAGDGRTLRDYQLAGLNWLAYRWVNNTNVILADEMGLGKTLQTISFIGWIRNEKQVAWPFLVIVPLSTLSAWQREFARWLPELNVLCYQGDAKSRSVIREHEFYCGSSGRSKQGSGVDAVKFDVLITTYELVMADQQELERFRWALIAIDEAHRLKNEQSALSVTLAGMASANRLLITGTPLQNSIRELWALLYFLHPERYPLAEDFESKYNFVELRSADRIAELHNELQPYILRRQKGDVEKSLPKKTYSVLRVGMTNVQQQYYRWILTRNFAKINAGIGGPGSAGSKYGGGSSTLLNIVMELKKCCNHPYLFAGAEAEDMQRLAAAGGGADSELSALVKASGKLILLDKLLQRLKEKGHRVLIFSQMVIMLDILQDYCRLRQFAYQRLDGSMPNDLRVRAVDHFNAPNSQDFVFLLSTRAGGLGINLATADTVIIFDSDWNPQNDLQAESRAHRIGQTKDVRVFRFLTRGTVEEDILERAKRKRVLEHLVIHGVERGSGDSVAGPKKGDGPKNVFKKDELSAILRFGAEELFKTAATGADGSTQVAAGGLSFGGGPALGAGPLTLTAGTATGNDAGTGNDVDASQVAVVTGDKTHQVSDAADIDALLEASPNDDANSAADEADSAGASLLNAFKWTDFSFEEEEAQRERQEEEQRKAAEASKAAAALRENEERKEKLARDVALQAERDKQMFSKEGDTEFWKRVIPQDDRENVIASELYIGRRQRNQTQKYEESAGGSSTAARRSRPGMDSKRAADLNNLKDARLLLKSFRKFGSVKRIGKVLEDAELVNTFSEAEATALIKSALDDAHAAIEALKHKQENPEKAAKVDQVDGALPSVGVAPKDKATNGTKPLGDDDEDVDEDEEDEDKDDDKNDADFAAEGGGGNAGGLAGGSGGSKNKAGTEKALFEFAGEKIDAEEFLARCNELSHLEQLVEEASGGDKNFRLHPQQYPAYRNAKYASIRWTPLLDSYLLIGVYRHGFGNFERIKNDPDLTLKQKIYLGTSDDTAAAGAPDTAKLQRRVVTLLKMLLKARLLPEKPKAQPKSSTAAKSTAKVKGSNGVVAPSSSKSKKIETSRAPEWKTIKSQLKDTLHHLMRLSDPSFEIDSKKRIARTKKCLKAIGDFISHQPNMSRKVEESLWDKVSEQCNTRKSGSELLSLYHTRLKDNA